MNTNKYPQGHLLTGQVKLLGIDQNPDVTKMLPIQHKEIRVIDKNHQKNRNLVYTVLFFLEKGSPKILHLYPLKLLQSQGTWRLKGWV